MRLIVASALDDHPASTKLFGLTLADQFATLPRRTCVTWVLCRCATVTLVPRWSFAMERNLIASAVFVGIILPTVGCRESDPPTTTEATAQSSPAQQDATLSPLKSTAHRFLQAVVDGDTQQATRLLTPQAVQQLQNSGKAFAPPGLETATFEIGEVRKLSDDQAFVQCYLTDSSAQQTTREEMCCVVKLVNGQWRISGIAFKIQPNQRPFILDFEKPARSGPAQGQMALQPFNSPSALAEPVADPLRNAQNQTIPTVR